ncbi:MFS general substrate transporter [Aspergillus homomorphus CBS 101889]|uniref:MFS general substrate transporter n=1 Tax=Aspergillus homomorphus (strain CBS 101889) TaxID=1450537 RepID=A0A395I227_ASPHC|nr:MFS general substrate transporter [Aspergillus homomorphus CBS 101889]RAL12604.1 MFS general substrate transporter [Aspergillus homomorphus CBS 101889]
MASDRQDSPTQSDPPRSHDGEKEVSAGAVTPPADFEQLESEITFPEGGRGAWLHFISREILVKSSSTEVGWIFGKYAFMTFFAGVQIGPTFDAKGPRGLMIAGSICTLVSIFTLSTYDSAHAHHGTKYYQLVLSFSLLGGLGSSLLQTHGIGCVSHWSNERRGLASGMAFTGAGFGGVLFPLMLQALLPQVRWDWAIRIIGIVRCDNTATTWKDTLPDPRIFMDGTGAMTITTIGVALTDMAYLVPMTYEPLADKVGFGYQLLAITNAASCVGRYLVGDLADRYGQYNTMTVFLLLCIVSVGGFFLPDVLVANLPTIALLLIFSLVFGFCSGSNISRTPICLGQLCKTGNYGRYYASCYTIVSFCCLTGVPIAGALLNATASTGKARNGGAVAFSGACYVVALFSFVWIRVRIKGWNCREKW